MEKLIFEDLPSTNTPINSTNLNRLQDNVETAINNKVEDILESDSTTTAPSIRVVNEALGNLNILGATASNSGSIVIGKLGIEWGQVSVTSAETGSEIQGITIYTGQTEITFTNKYKNAPQVPTFWRGAYSNQLTTVSGSTSTTGCTIYGKLLTASSTRTVGYFVIGEIAE